MVGVVDGPLADHDGDRGSDRRRQCRLDIGSVLVALPAVGRVGDVEVPGRAVVTAERPSRVQRPHDRLHRGLDGGLPRVGNGDACDRRSVRGRGGSRVGGRRFGGIRRIGRWRRRSRRGGRRGGGSLRPPAEHRPSRAGIDGCWARGRLAGCSRSTAGLHRLLEAFEPRCQRAEIAAGVAVRELNEGDLDEDPRVRCMAHVDQRRTQRLDRPHERRCAELLRLGRHLVDTVLGELYQLRSHQ